MKSLMLGLLVSGFLIGCSQPKDRLADLKNKEYQKRLAEARGKKDGKNPVIYQDSDLSESRPHNGQSIPEGTLPELPKTPDVISSRSQPTNENSQTGSVALPRIVTAQETETPVDTSLVDDVRRQPKPQSQSTSVSESTSNSNTDSANPEASSSLASPGTSDSTASDTDKTSDESFLTFEEYYILGQVLSSVFPSQEALQYLTNPVGTQQIKLINVDQKDKALNLTFGDSGRILGEVKGILLQPDQAHKDKVKDFSFLGFCAYPDCTTFFFTLHKVENETLVFNLPMVLKQVKGQFVEAKVHPIEFYQKALQEYAAQQKAKGGQK